MKGENVLRSLAHVSSRHLGSSGRLRRLERKKGTGQMISALDPAEAKAGYAPSPWQELLSRVREVYIHTSIRQKQAVSSVAMSKSFGP